MQNNVTFETAKRLKEANVLPSEIEPFQVWYTPMGFPYIVVKNDGHHEGDNENTFFLICPLAAGMPKTQPLQESGFSSLFWAPTAADLLKLINDSVYYHNGEFVLSGRWEASNGNFAEAIAEAYLNDRKQD